LQAQLRLGVGQSGRGVAQLLLECRDRRARRRKLGTQFLNLRFQALEFCLRFRNNELCRFVVDEVRHFHITLCSIRQSNLCVVAVA